MFRLRLLRLIASWLATPVRGLLDAHEFSLSAWPVVDVDVSRMMAHAYTRAFAIGRYQLVFASEFRNFALKKKWFPMATAEMSYIYKPVRLLDSFTVRSRIIAWNEKRFYAEQEVLVGGELRARCIVEGLIGTGREFLNPVEVFREMGVTRESPEMTAEVKAWIENRKKKVSSSLLMGQVD